VDTRQAIQAAVNEMASRAQAAGYDANRAVERLAFGSFVSPRHRYMYVETPKAACTSFKHLIAAIEGLSPDSGALPYQRETRPDMLIHQRRYLALPTLLDVDAETRATILDGSPDWFVFALVRNPFSRLVSFFENKIRQGEPGYRRLEARYGDAARFSGLQQAFAAFVGEVVTDPALLRGDSHLLPQNEVIMPRLIPYTKVFRLEEADAAVAALNAHLAGMDVPDVALAHNRSAGRDWRGYYDPATAAIVAKAYQEDFALFGYDPSDWQGGNAATTPSPLEEYWRGEIVARNALIDRLYSHLGVQPAGNAAEMRLARERPGKG
jgi:hypothetical protein